MNPQGLAILSNQNSSVVGNAQNTASIVSVVNALATGATGPHSVNSSNSASQVLTKQRLQDLVREVDSNVQLDDDVEELLLNLAEDFIDDVLDTSCKLASYRKSSTLEVKDVQFSLEKNWNMWIPGFGCEELKPYKISSITKAHQQRMALLRKSFKKT